jgi:ferric-dicitrate binding protein FerR (iron transport regulator)
MHEATESKRLLAILRDRPVSVDPARTEARRAKQLPLLEERVQTLAARRNRSKKRRIVIGCFAAAAASIVFGFALPEFRKAPVVVAGAEIRAIEGHLSYGDGAAERAVAPGDSLALPVAGELRTNTSEATLETSRGLRLHMESGARLGLSGLSRNGLDGSVRLDQGQITCAVPKLHAGALFSVVTPNARVVVHGTQFTVRVDSAEAGVTRTCVRVTEGVVAVQQQSAAEAMLHAGDEWGCEARPATASPADTGRPQKAGPGARGRVAQPVRGSTLAEETALLQNALAAERKGRPGAAAVAAGRLLARFPDSPLAPEARAVLDRVSTRPNEAR